jgi:hypothetical protein
MMLYPDNPGMVSLRAETSVEVMAVGHGLNPAQVVDSSLNAARGMITRTSLPSAAAATI